MRLFLMSVTAFFALQALAMLVVAVAVLVEWGPPRFDREAAAVSALAALYTSWCTTLCALSIFWLRSGDFR
jgi:hypothetical protein